MPRPSRNTPVLEETVTETVEETVTETFETELPEIVYAYLVGQYEKTRKGVLIKDEIQDAPTGKVLVETYELITETVAEEQPWFKEAANGDKVHVSGLSEYRHLIQAPEGFTLTWKAEAVKVRKPRMTKRAKELAAAMVAEAALEVVDNSVDEI